VVRGLLEELLGYALLDLPSPNANSVASEALSRYPSGVTKRGNGDGTIDRTKDGRWVARYFVETAGGKKRKTIYCRTRLEVATKLAHAIAQRDGRSPFDLDADKLTLSDYLDRWLASKKHEIAASTYRVYERVARLKIKPVLGSVLMRDLRPAHVEALKAGLLDEGLAPSTISHAMDVLSGALGRAVSWEVAQTNAASRISRPKGRGKRHCDSSRRPAAPRGRPST
jgi:integrase